VPTNPTPDSPQELWRSQKEETAAMTLADIRRKAETFQTTIQRRNTREYVGLAFGTILYGFFIWSLSGLLTQVGAALTLLAMYHSVWQLHRDGAARTLPADAAAGDCLAFHRRELTRQRDMLRRVGPWHIGPMVPGLTLLFVGQWLDTVRSREDAAIMAISVVICALVLTGVYWLNVRAANRLQRDLDLLPE
jgi:uncharacterized protein with PQ loop repeat